MSYQALYRKWRPQLFEDIVGQKHIVQILKNQIISNRIAHAYLFCGTRGTGKTTTAKVLSKAVNCIDINQGNPCNKCKICIGITNGSNIDVIEIDAASNNGVENIREIREEVVYTPAQSTYKVYIVDEVHMLSASAFNALLKTLEEPPKHVIFILATTEPHKLPATILSRCQRFDFKRITTDDIVGRLKYVTDSDKINIEYEALGLIARAAKGSMRDALSTLDQCAAFSSEHISYQDIGPLLGITDKIFLFNITKTISDEDANTAIKILGQLIDQGIDILNLTNDLIEHFRDLLLCKTLKEPKDILDLPQEDIIKLKEQSKDFTEEKLLSCIRALTETYSSLKWSENQRILLEVAIIKLCRTNLDTSTHTLLARISDLEEKISRGIVIKKNENNEVKTSFKQDDSQQSDNSNLENINTDKLEDTSNTENIENIENTDSTDKIDTVPDVEKVIHMWKKVLKELKKLQEVGLCGFLQNAETTCKDGKLNIILENDFIIEQDKKNGKRNLQSIKQAIKNISNIDVNIKFCTKQQAAEEDIQLKDKDIIDKIIEMKKDMGDTMQIYD